MDNYERQQAANGLKAMQWDVTLMMSLTPEQRRAVDAAVRALDCSPVLQSLRSLLPVGHPLK
jgi:hypothetical protein